MPCYNCRFCNKLFNHTWEFYCHLNKHIKTNENEIDIEERQLINYYYNNRSKIKKKSYEKLKELRQKSILEYKYKCNICDFKCQFTHIIKTHLIGKHTLSKLLQAGYEKEFVDMLIEEKNKRSEYMKNYHNSSCSITVLPKSNILNKLFNKHIPPPPLIDFSETPYIDISQLYSLIPIINMVQMIYLSNYL